MAPPALLDAMRAAGCEPAKPLDIETGRLLRFRVAGDKPGSRNGWVVFHAEPRPAAGFGSWRTGAAHTWHEPAAGLVSPQVRAELREQLQRLRVAREAERDRVQATAASRAERLWRTARPATDAHPYLQRKVVHAYGLRQLRDMLLIPARDVSGRLHTLQFIGADGAKRFLTGGRLDGCYCAIGRPTGRLILAEGYATAATLHAATGDAVAACFTCVNLRSVALALRAKFPGLVLVIAADDDRGTPGNPGVSRAREAAEAAGALVAVPVFAGAAA
jgi:putative DNA primase/helicase